MPKTVTTVVLIAIAALAGLLAQVLGLPLPFLLGPLLSSGLISAACSSALPDGYAFPNWLRLAFISVIGLMIGAQVSPSLARDAPRLTISFAAIILFVILALQLNYWIFRKIGSYDRATAFYSATPGGLFESIALGEEAGADTARLTLQQFLRVICVVTILPIGLSLWLGAPIGSAGGMTLAQTDVPWSDLPLILLACGGGIILGRVMRLPARQLTGPLAVAALLSVTGVMSLEIPQWLVNIAQIVVGTALGMRFAGVNHSLILNCAWLSLISVGTMLIMSAVFAATLHNITGEAFDVLLISFAPGGVTEMALVAPSLEASPAFVTLHHIWRILVTVLGLGISTRWLRHRL